MSAGCLGVLTGSEPITFEAQQATVSADTLEETDYQEDDVSSEMITRSFSAAGQTREVEVTNWEAVCARSVDFGSLGQREAALFVALSTPQVRVLDRTFNPVGQMSNRELLRELQSRYEGLTIRDQVDTTNVSILEEEVEVEKFDGTATFQGVEIDIFIHSATVAHEGDFVVPVAVYPQQLPDEEQRVIALYQAIEH